MNDFTADDMQHGDMSKARILQQGNVKFMTAFDFNKKAEDHFNEMNNMANVTAWGQYSPLIKAMIARFKGNEGGIFRSNLLDKAFVEHKTTLNCVDRIKSFIAKEFTSNNKGAFSLGNNSNIEGGISTKVKLPTFYDYNLTNGLGVAIHDTQNLS